MTAAGAGNVYTVTYNATHTFTIARAAGGTNFDIRTSGTTNSLETEIGITGNSGSVTTFTTQIGQGDSDLFRTTCAAGTPRSIPATRFAPA